MSEHEPHPPTGEGGLNRYGTDDPTEQARIERARADASAERRRNRTRLERYIEAGLNPEDAQAAVEFEDAEREQRAREQEATETPEANESEPAIRPRIYVRSLVDYNEGHDIGDWVDANQDVDDLQADIQRILARSLHAHWTGQPSEEWAIHDYDGFGSVQLSEYESLDVVSRLGHGVAEHGLAYAAWAEINDARDTATLDQFREAYLGAFERRQDYAEHLVEEMEAERHLATLPNWLRDVTRIDYEAIVHELETSGSVRFADHPGGVWVFDGRV